MKRYVIIYSLFVVIGFYGCFNESQTNTVQVDNMQTPVPFDSPTPEPSPTPAPTATPAPSPAIFDLLRSNISIMNQEQLKDYLAGITGKKVEHWTGFVKDKPLLDDGYYGVTLEMDKEMGERPDLVLVKLDQQSLESIETGQIIRFSGTIAGFTSVNGLLNILALQEVLIHQ